MNMYKRKAYKGFTLAETLLALMIIGILAMIIIPSVIQAVEERITVTRLKKTYSIMQQAFKLAVIEYGPPDTWGLSSNNILDNMEKFLPVLKNCKQSPLTLGCSIPKDYYIYNYYIWAGQNDYTKYLDPKNVYVMELKDGTLIGNWGTIYPKCDSSEWMVSNELYCVSIWVDTNGKKGPNVFGIDVFAFSLTKKGFIPWGGVGGTGNTINHTQCKITGYGCARWVIERGNMDYLHKNTYW